MAEAKLLSAEDVIDAPAQDYVTVDVPLWGGAVRLGSLTAFELLQWMENKETHAGLRLYAMCHVDADGNRLGMTVDDKGVCTIKPGYMDALKKKDAKSTGKVVAAAFKLNGLSKDQIASIKNDSGEAAPVASPSGSQGN